MAGKGLENLPLSRIPAQWDPKWFAQFIREVLAKADVRNALGNGVVITGNTDQVGTISVSEDITSLLNQQFVLANPSGFLSHERVLAGESGVVDIIDGGDNADITVRIAANGLALSKLAIQTTWGVLGNKFDENSNVQMITPTATGQALTVNGTTLDWQTAPVWSGDHQWLDTFGIILGTGGDLTIEFDGTAGHIASAAALDVSTFSVTFTVDSADTFAFSDTGEFLLNGAAGTAGDVLTSAGAGAPPTWTPSAGGGGSMVQLASVTLGSPAATIAFSSIPSSYQSLLLIFSVNSATQFDTLYMQFNGDTAANYDTAQAYGGSGSIAGGAATLNNAKPEMGSMPGSAFSANQRATGDIIIPFYADTTAYKTSSVSSSRRDATQLFRTSYAHNWHSTAAINAILFGFASGNNFVAGSTITLYGIA